MESAASEMHNDLHKCIFHRVVLRWPVANMDYWQPLRYIEGHTEGCKGKKSGTEGSHPSINSSPYVTHHPLK